MDGRKAVGVRCIHLMDDYKCALFNDPSRPKVCSDFKAEPDFCGSDRDEALRILYSLSDTPVPSKRDSH
jgi:hypothetical protein